jgi:hypothetical protein
MIQTKLLRAHFTITGCLLSAVVSVLLLASPASAGTVTLYDNTASFLSNFQFSYFEDFNNLDVQLINTNPTGALTFSGGPGAAYSYSVDAASPAGNSVYVIDNSSCAPAPAPACWTNDPTLNDKALSTFFGNSSLVFTFGSGIDAVGGSFFLTDSNGNLAPGALIITLNDGTQQTLTDPGASGFNGFISSGVDISSLTVSTDTPFVFVTANNVYVATPEPYSIALILSGLAAGACRMFRNRARWLS